MSTRARRELDELYRGHREAVYRFLLRDLRDPHEAEDVTQSAFLQAYGSVLRGRHPERPRAWLLTIADNLRRRRFRRAERRPREVPLDDVDIAAPETPSASELGEALGQLPPQQRSALVLREIAGLTYEEIASRLGVTVGSVQMLLFRARRALRERLDAAGRRASAFVPGWLWNQLGQGDRFALPARSVGVAVAIGVAALVTSGAPAAPEDRVVARPSLVVVAPARPEPATIDSGRRSTIVADRSRAGHSSPRPARRVAAAPPATDAPPAQTSGGSGLPLPPAPELPSVAIWAPTVPDVSSLPAPPLPGLPLPVEVDPPDVPPLPSLP